MTAGIFDDLCSMMKSSLMEMAPPDSCLVAWAQICYRNLQMARAGEQHLDEMASVPRYPLIDGSCKEDSGSLLLMIPAGPNSKDSCCLLLLFENQSHSCSLVLREVHLKSVQSLKFAAKEH